MSKVSKFKIVFVGDQNVGKTSIISRFIQDTFQPTANPTVGIDFVSRIMEIQQETLRLQLWDTAGQQRFRSLIPTYVRSADCCIIVLDLTSQSSFEGLDRWYEFVTEQRGQDGLVFFVGNKVDIPQRQVSQKQMEKYAQQNGSQYIQVSAKNGTNINQLFRKVGQKLISNKMEPIITQELPKLQKDTIVLKKVQNRNPLDQKTCNC